MGAPSSKRAKHWKKHVDAFHASGLSQGEYCRKFDVKQPTLRYWRLKFGENPGGTTRKPIQLVPIAVVDQPVQRVDASLRLVIERAGAVEVRGDLGAIAELVRMLGGGAK